ncbi:LysR family transcriptional regulator [Sulfitobacter donghicola]|uniref:HTH lysR-type domain-containing protein n=1 Tax=Sulfitobacter donghicola DSW-25 = KCTC 12864 = JCM 14565 TaxID=1300350 RepID=A0A073IDQ7_9RHOB|nr:LysR family transcriptional regulator [Sulfitobacter donghicola]KEJ87879.1 hypothetical protein DSW25_04475 [Sulfitobacter donghicola DSW-25 = KCTC 12864 = JCM 14565]KIN67274.1 Transcriptional regulator [Sulfitobacter donghicola DSW-25 = KCTC 12864 = JCM 14565]
MATIKKIKIDTLNQFAVVARERSFSKAAKVLGMQVSTLSRHITALEDALGVKLLLRTTRAVVLTNDGIAYLDRISPLLNELDLATRDVAESKYKMRGVVRIATTAAMADICVVPIIKTLRSDFPDIRIELLLSAEIQDMRAHRVDFAIRAGKLRDSTQIVRKIGEHEFQVYAAPDCAKQTSPRILAYNSQNAKAANPTLMCENYAILRQLAVAGEGHAKMPVAYCQNEERQGLLVRVAPHSPSFFEVFVAYPKGAVLTDRARATMELVIQQAKETAKIERELAMASN